MSEDLRGQGIIDSRDCIARLSELEDLRQEGTLTEATEESWTGPDGTIFDFDIWDNELEEEYLELKDIEETIDGWKDGVTLINDNYFEDYTREFASDIGAISDENAWPCCHIDWEAAADSLKQDFTQVEFGGETYYVKE